MAVAQHRITYDELCEMPDDGILYELLDGALVTRAAPTFRHQRVVSGLDRLFAPIEEAGHGIVVLGPFDVVFDQYNMTLPDLIFVRSERQEIVTDTGCHGAPDLIVEVVSPTSVERDWEDKRRTYERFGVRSYWIIDFIGQTTLHRLDLVDGRYVERQPLHPGDALTSSLFPGVALDIGRLFARGGAGERPQAPAQGTDAVAPPLDPPLPVDPAQVARLERWHQSRRPPQDRDDDRGG